MKFIIFGDKDFFELFLKSARIGGPEVVLQFGPERVTFVKTDEDEEILTSGQFIPVKTTIEGEQFYQVGINVQSLLDDIKEFPEGELGIALTDTSSQLIMQMDDITSTTMTIIPTPESDVLPGFDYSIDMIVDTELLNRPLNDINTIFEVNDAGFVIQQYLIPEDKIEWRKRSEGDFHTTISSRAFGKVLELLSMYASIRIVMGTDIPVVLMAYSELVCIGFMIANQVEEGDAPR